MSPPVIRYQADLTPWLRGPLSGIGLTALATTLALEHHHPELELKKVWRGTGSKKLAAQLDVQRWPLWNQLVGDSNTRHLSFEHSLNPAFVSQKISVVHDVWTLNENNLFQSSDYQKTQAIKLLKVFDRARKIICPTQVVADQIVERFPWRNGSVFVVPWASVINAQEELLPKVVGNLDILNPFPESPDKVDLFLTDSRRKDRPFVLMVGNLENRKNPIVALQAIQKNPNIDFVLVGSRGFGWEKLRAQMARITLEIQRNDPNFQMLWLEQGVAPGTLKKLYFNSVACVQPSLDEGFGLPALEALTQNKVLIYSKIPALMEICGAHGLAFDLKARDGGVEELAHYLRQIIDQGSEEWKQKLKPTQRASEFSWARVAREFHRVLTN